jgi:hypothetical protein
MWRTLEFVVGNEDVAVLSRWVRLVILREEADVPVFEEDAAFWEDRLNRIHVLFGEYFSTIKLSS